MTMIKCPGTGERAAGIHSSGALRCPACNGVYFSAGINLDYHEVEAERPIRIVQIARCDWCHKQQKVSSGAEADMWLRTHDCPENVK